HIPLAPDGRWKRRLIARAPRPTFFEISNGFSVLGFNRERELQIAYRVLVCAVHLRLIGQGRELGQRRSHLLRRALEQPPAARAEQRIAAEQGAVTDVRDVSRCVSRDIQHLEAQIELRERSCVSFPQRSRLTGYVFPRRAAYRPAEVGSASGRGRWTG